MKRLADIEGGIGRYYDAIAPLVASPKLGPVLWQLPERFARDMPRLADDGYVYFKDWEGFAVKNALRMRALLS